MSSTPERSRYRKFVFASADRRSELSGDYIHVVSARLGRAFRLSPAEFELARLIDGTRDAASIRAAAAELGQPVTEAELNHFLVELAQADLLIAGYEEAMPVLPQTDAEAALIGTPGYQRSGVAAPSTMPGSLSAPGLPGSLAGSTAKYRGEAGELGIRLPAGPFLWLGSLLALPAMSWMLFIPLLIVVGVLIGQLWGARAAVTADFPKLLHLVPLLVVGLGGMWLQNFLSQIARAASVAAVGGAKPQFGLAFALGFIPWFHAPTAGAVERASRSGRLRVVASSLSAQLVVLALAIVGYFVTYRTGTMLGPVCLGVAAVTALFLFINLNPLTRRDGYYLLAQWLEIPDLREQATAMVFGLSRPWQQAPTLSPTTLVLYAVLCAAYMVLVCYLLITGPGTWFEEGWGPTGVVIFLALIALLLYDIISRVASRRGSIGNIKLAAPSTWLWIIGFGLAAVSLIPYTYEPSGDFRVLPHNRADVRALIAGDVREVMAKEGDMVQQGQVLARLADDEERAHVDQSKAELERLRAELALRKSGGKPEEIAVAVQNVETAKTHYTYARTEADRVDAAFKRKAISQQDRDRAVGQADVAKQQLAEAQRHLDLVKSPSKDDAIKAVEAQIAAEESQLAYHQQQLSYTEIRAPIAGRLVSRNLELMFPLGQYLQRGAQYATVEDTSKLYAEILMPEVAMGEVHVGSPATIKAAAYPGTEFPGTVSEIAPDAQQQPGGPKVVRVLVVVDDTKGMLKPEMTGQAKVEGGVYPAAAAFTRPIIRFVLVEVWSWLP